MHGGLCVELHFGSNVLCRMVVRKMHSTVRLSCVIVVTWDGAILLHIQRLVAGVRSSYSAFDCRLDDLDAQRGQVFPLVHSAKIGCGGHQVSRSECEPDC